MFEVKKYKIGDIDIAEELQNRNKSNTRTNINNQ